MWGRESEKKNPDMLTWAAHILKLEQYRRLISMVLCKDDTQIHEVFHIFLLKITSQHQSLIFKSEIEHNYFPDIKMKIFNIFRWMNKFLIYLVKPFRE